MYLFSLFSLACLVLYSDGTPAPCNLEDESCVSEAFSSIYNEVVDGNSSYGIESSDPVRKELVQATLTLLNYTLINGELFGLKNCKVVRAKFTNDVTKFNFDINCPLLVLHAQYGIHGRILSFDLVGEGDASVYSEKYNILFNTDVEKKVEEGNTFIALKNFNTDFTVDGKVVYDFKNLFNGNVELSNKVLETINKNWQYISKETHGPATNSFLEILINNINKYFENVPIEKAFFTKNLTKF